jgi:hypothetical protein
MDPTIEAFDDRLTHSLAAKLNALMPCTAHVAY